MSSWHSACSRSPLTAIGTSGWASWFPNGARVAFLSNRDGNPEIYAANLDGTNLVRLTNHPADDSTPAVSPLGNRIAFVSNRDGNVEIYVMDALDGGNVARLTTNSVQDGWPCWSPDGTRIAFVRDADLWVMNADGSGQVPLVAGPGDDLAPRWSPDGQRIVFTSNRDGDYEIFTVDADGGNLVQRTFNTNPDTDPDWSPDGSSITFTSMRLGDLFQSTWVMNADGSGQRRLSAPAAEYRFPRWAPVGERILTESGGGLVVLDLITAQSSRYYDLVVDTPPVLSNGSVTPSVGSSGELFEFSVTYTDADNDAPDSIEVIVDEATGTTLIRWSLSIRAILYTPTVALTTRSYIFRSGTTPSASAPKLARPRWSTRRGRRPWRGRSTPRRSLGRLPTPPTARRLPTPR